MSAQRYPLSKTAVILVDPFNDFMSFRGKLSLLLRKVIKQVDAVSHIKTIIACARGANIQIVYAPHERYRTGVFSKRRYLHPSQIGQRSARIFEKGKFGGDFYAPLTPQRTDIIASAHTCSSGFAETDLHDRLSDRGITHLIIIGFLSNTCIEATARSAVDLDYHVTLVNDAVASWSPADHDAAVAVNYQHLAQQLISTKQLVEMMKQTGDSHA